MVLPKVRFSPWLKWDERKQLDCAAQGGVYVLARFTDKPSVKVDLLDERVVYFGVSCDRTFAIRHSEFHRCAFEGALKKHSGGKTYYRKIDPKDGKTLWLSAFPVVGIEEPLHTAYILYVERKLILEFVQRHGRLPTCNST